jgi:predicted TIM-barrel fold metal-dependent hydrolase
MRTVVEATTSTRASFSLALLRVLQDACDCHVHVFGPAARFPFAKERTYTPPEASVEELLAHQEQLGLERAVIVQPSPYGTDNSCTLDALRRLGARARGVVVLDQGIKDFQLREMHAAGVRGIRVDLETGGERDPARTRRALDAAAAQAAPLGWHVELCANSRLIQELKVFLQGLAVPLVVDHFGLPKEEKSFDSLLELVRRGKAYVKLSAPHRFAVEPDCADAEPYARALCEANADRVLWGSDWPHPAAQGVAWRKDEITPFDVIDDRAALERVAGWLEDSSQLEKILIGNPAKLYEF